jgi:hypothetical protein
MIIGIAYHSPLDVVALLPTNMKYSTNPLDDVDILISECVVKKYNARVQLVFTSARVLFKENLPIIDHGAWGKVIPLTGELLEDTLNKKSYSSVPDWAKF